MHRQVDLAAIKGGCISGLESGEIDFLMDISNPNNPVDQLTGFNSLQDKEWNNLMETLNFDSTANTSNPTDLSDDAQFLIECELNSAKNKATTAQTTQYVEKFRKFLSGENLPSKFEDIPDRYLVKYLQFWLVSSRRLDGKRFAPSTYTCMRAAIHRHLLESRNRSILGNPEYAILDKTVKACIAAHLREPRETRHQYDAIEPEDMEKLGEYFNRSTPSRLLWEVFFLIIYHFGFRGREWLRNLTKKSIIIKFCPVMKLKLLCSVNDKRWFRWVVPLTTHT